KGDAEEKAREAAGTEEGERFRLGAYGERTPAEEAIFDLWNQPSGEGGLEEVLRKSAELKEIAIAERKVKMAKCPPIKKTEEAEAAVEAPEKPGEMPKTAAAAAKPETAKCPPIKKTEEAEPAAPPAEEDAAVRVDSFRPAPSVSWGWTEPAPPYVDPWVARRRTE
ncbi:MAG: hypothetical protein LBU23_06850, partial [Planctomycetota bacterium]|nr:hypothetical protein [Planctomycetota bacterium]